MAHSVYRETFDAGPGGWMTWLGPNRPAAPEIVDGALFSRSPWGIDANHAPPGGEYLHLLFILFTEPQANPSPVYAPLMTGNRFIDAGYSTELQNARLTVRLKGEVNLKGAKFVLHCQSCVGDKAINFVLRREFLQIPLIWSIRSTNILPWPTAAPMARPNSRGATRTLRAILIMGRCPCPAQRGSWRQRLSCP